MFGPLFNLLNAWSFFSISMDCNTTYQWKLSKGEVLNVNPLRTGAIVSTSISTGFTYKIYKVTEQGVIEEENPSIRKLGTGYKAVNFGGFRGKLEIAATEDIDFYIHVRFPLSQPDGIIEVVETDKPLVEITAPAAPVQPLLPAEPEQPLLPPAEPEQSNQNDALQPEQNANTYNYRYGTQASEDTGSGTLIFSVIIGVGILALIVKKKRKANHGANEEMDISGSSDLDDYVPIVLGDSRNPQVHHSHTGYQQPHVIVSQPTVVAYSSPL